MTASSRASTPWLLGVPGSGCSPGVTVDGGGRRSRQRLLSRSSRSWRLPTIVPATALFLMPITPDGSMLVAAVSFVPTVTDATVKYQAVVYNDLNGKPFQLLGVWRRGDWASRLACWRPARSPTASASSANYELLGRHFHDAAIYVTIANTRNQGRSYSNTYSNGPPDEHPRQLSWADWQVWADLIGSSVFAARAYLYTWVTEYGEEGPPSEPAMVNGWSNAIWTVSLYTPTPENMGVDRNITKTRIYRIDLQSVRAGVVFLGGRDSGRAGDLCRHPRRRRGVAQFAVGVAVSGTRRRPTSRRCCRSPTGSRSACKANEVWFSEAYRPHAWPPNYVLTTEFPIVGIGVCGQSIVVCTQGSPYLVTGINPSSMALTKINLPEPCLHRGSIVSTDTTVLYASQNGLIQISQSGAGGNVTEGWICRERWQELMPQKQIRAVKHATSYFAFGCKFGRRHLGGARWLHDRAVERGPDQLHHLAAAGRAPAGFSQAELAERLRHRERAARSVDRCWPAGAGRLGLLLRLHRRRSGASSPYKWRSKTFQQTARKNFQAMRVWFTVPPSTPAQVERNVSRPAARLGPNQYGIVRVYADGELWTTRELRKSGELLRIYSGIKGEQWQFEVEGRVNVQQFASRHVREGAGAGLRRLSWLMVLHRSVISCAGSCGPSRYASRSRRSGGRPTRLRRSRRSTRSPTMLDKLHAMRAGREIKRNTQRVRIHNAENYNQWVEVERITRIVFENKVTGATFEWSHTSRPDATGVRRSPASTRSSHGAVKGPHEGGGRHAALRRGHHSSGSWTSILVAGAMGDVRQWRSLLLHPLRHVNLDATDEQAWHGSGLARFSVTAASSTAAPMPWSTASRRS